jgi:hypothetical protein
VERGPEIAGAKARLEALSDQRVRAFSIPYGLERDAPQAIMAATRGAGHEAVFLVHAGSDAFRMVSDLWYRVSFHAGTMNAPGCQVTVPPMLRSFKAMLGR